jgi:putative two-component system response regulator
VRRPRPRRPRSPTCGGCSRPPRRLARDLQRRAAGPGASRAGEHRRRVERLESDEQRTHDYAVALAEAVDPELAADEQLRYGFLLHDVGKVGIPEAVLNKPGPLDAEEWEVMRAHPLLGVQMVAGIKSLGGAVEVIRCHHERWDGKGYPTGLAGEAIPAGARVFSVADAFDAMTSDRRYRKAIPFDQACQKIADGAGSQFDPMVVDAFTTIVPDLPGLHASLHTGAVDSLTHVVP